jgi:hypothetical protein
LPRFLMTGSGPEFLGNGRGMAKAGQTISAAYA